MSNRDKFSTKRHKLTTEALMVKMSDMGEENFYNKVYEHRKRLYGLVADTDVYDSVPPPPPHTHIYVVITSPYILVKYSINTLF